MPTPIEQVINVFYSKFQSRVFIDEGLVHQFVIGATADFSIDLYPISISDDKQFINEILNVSEVDLLGAFMYKQYLHRERDKILKLNNIVGRDIKLTAMGTSKQAINTTYRELLGEIAIKVDKLKPLIFD